MNELVKAEKMKQIKLEASLFILRISVF